MATHKSAKKRARQTITRTARNKSETSSVRSVVKGLRLAIENKEKDSATALFKTAQARLAKLAQTGIIKANSAARRTARLASQVSRL